MFRKRKKSSKLVRMNEEERMRYMQHRLEFELETKRRKQQLIAIFTKNKLKHEEVFSKLNIAKINEKWRYVLRQIKCKEFHKNVKYLNTTFDRVVKIKDATISYLYNELKIVDTDHRKLQETYILLINNIIAIYKQKLVELHDMYKLNNIKMNSMIELIELRNYIGQYKEIANNITRKCIIFDQTQTIRKTYNATNIFNILYLEKDRASHFIHQAFLKIEKFWEQLCRIINEYQRIIENKKKQYEYLKEQDDVHQMCLLQYPKIYLQLQNIIETLKVNVRILSEKRKVQIAKLKRKDINIQERYKNIKYKFTVTQMISSVQLKKLIVRSNEVLKHLQKILKKSSIILEIIKICTTLEPLFFNLKKYFMQNTLYTEYVDANIPESCAKVNNFWEYFNYIKGNNILLKKQTNELCRENKKLKCKLQIYFSVDSGMLIYLITLLFYYFLLL
ncbi:dynein regulatory complex subunit 2 [Frieseomelitta varia]|uniref:dynein regulatory complex subunit 2 n=1 Tax=Frieseomelitta varia TaxID=561572 RepID=UPI001CB67C35|nr:dynein regulatory complex subunit 2 [Frieseomelitta varia]